MAAKHLPAITTTFIFLLAARAVSTDVVWIKNGDRITGDHRYWVCLTGRPSG